MTVAGSGLSRSMEGRLEMSEMIERVGRVIADAEGYAYAPHPYDKYAIAAIAAMREPTEAMIESGSDGRQPGNSRWGNTTKTWKAMIDEAMK